MALLPWEDQGLQWTLVILSMELQDIESIFTCKTLYTKKSISNLHAPSHAPIYLSVCYALPYSLIERRAQWWRAG